MPSRDFSINVSNPASDASSPVLSLELVTDPELAQLGYDLPPGRLSIRSVRMTTQASASTLTGCVDGVRSLFIGLLAMIFQRTLIPKPLAVRLKGGETATVRVRINAAGSNGVAGLHLVDRRGGRIIGGALLLVVDGPIDAHRGPVRATNPCPMVLAEQPFWLPKDSDPAANRPGGPIPAGYRVMVVVPITNPTEASLEGVTAYLEHLGGADSEIRPATWNLGTVEPGATLPVHWTIEPHGLTNGPFIASVVVESESYDPVRVHAPIEVFSEVLDALTKAAGEVARLA